MFSQIIVKRFARVVSDSIQNLKPKVNREIRRFRVVDIIQNIHTYLVFAPIVLLSAGDKLDCF